MTWLRDRHFVLIGIIASTISIVLAILLEDFFRPSDFLNYRLGLNLHYSQALVYNPGKWILVTLSPLPATLFSLDPHNAHNIATILFVLSNIASTLLIYRLLKNTRFKETEIVTLILIWLFSWPLWAGFRSLNSLTLCLVLLIMLAIDTKRGRTAGLITGLLPIISMTAIAATLALSIYAALRHNNKRFWQMIWMPMAIWSIIASLTYDQIMISPEYISAQWQDVFWIILLISGILATSRQWENNLFSVLLMWVGIEIAGRFIFEGELRSLDNAAIGLIVGFAIILITRKWTSTDNPVIPVLSVTGFGLILIAFPPRTASDLAAEIKIAQNTHLTMTSSIVHPYTDALPYFIDVFQGAAYRVDGKRNDEINQLIQRNSTDSVIIALAPDYIIENANLSLNAELVSTFSYVNVADNLWQRANSILPFNPTNSTIISIGDGEDAYIIGYALDNTRPVPGETIRFRIDWHFVRTTSEIIGLQFDLLDANNNVIVSEKDTLEDPTGLNNNLTSFHAFSIPDNTPIGLSRLFITVEYRTGLMANTQLTEIVIPPNIQITDFSDTPSGRLGNIILYDSSFESDGSNLDVSLYLGADAPLEKDYLIFLHLVPNNDLTPITQSDGPPVEGRLPTSYWRTNEIILDERSLNIREISAGDYQINIGFYTVDGERLRNGNADFLNIAEVTIGSDGTITINPQTEP